MRYSSKVLLILIACLGIVSLAGCFGGGGGPALSKTFNVTGKVTTAGVGHPATAHPVIGAVVSVGQAVTSTNMEGVYELRGLTTTAHYVTITVTKQDYAPAAATIAV